MHVCDTCRSCLGFDSTLQHPAVQIALGQQAAVAAEALAVAATMQLGGGSLGGSLRVLHAGGAVAALDLAPAVLQCDGVSPLT